MPWKTQEIGAYTLSWFERSHKGPDFNNEGHKLEAPVKTYRLDGPDLVNRRFMSMAAARAWAATH